MSMNIPREKINLKNAAISFGSMTTTEWKWPLESRQSSATYLCAD